MIPPSGRRPAVWRGGILQIIVTRACDLACVHCTQGANLKHRPATMTPDQFDEACRSLAGYWGVVGMFGGNPCVHPQFDLLCEIMRGHFPLEQRGIWTNNLMGHGAAARITFWPGHSNLNMHLDAEAREEFARDWPESIPHLRGVDQDSVHSAPWVAMKDVIPDEAARWRLIGQCDINRHWSAAIGVIPGRGMRAYFCEIAASMAALHCADPDWPDVGLPVVPGWWQRPMADFEAQVTLHCHACGIPLRRPGKGAQTGGPEEYTATHAAIVRPKISDRPIELVTIGPGPRPDRPATEYLPGVTPGYRSC